MLISDAARTDLQDAMYQTTTREWAEDFVREKRSETKKDAAVAAFLSSLE